MPVATLRAKHASLRAVLTERSRRLWAATEARALGHGGIAVVARATGLSRATIAWGLAELDADAPLPTDRVRTPGGGRKRVTTHHPTLLRALDTLVEPTAPGGPDSPLRWTCLSTRTLAVALEALGYSVSHAGVAVTDAQLASVRLERHRFHGDWNYTIRPATPSRDATVIS